MNSTEAKQFINTHLEVWKHGPFVLHLAKGLSRNEAYSEVCKRLKREPVMQWHYNPATGKANAI